MYMYFLSTKRLTMVGQGRMRDARTGKRGRGGLKFYICVDRIFKDRGR